MCIKVSSVSLGTLHSYHTLNTAFYLLKTDFCKTFSIGKIIYTAVICIVEVNTFKDTCVLQQLS